MCWTSLWRHNERNGVSNHQPYDCLLNRLFRHRPKKTSKHRVTGLCEGHSPATDEFPSQRASNAENVSIWWRHHESYWMRCIRLLRCHKAKANTHSTHSLVMGTIILIQLSLWNDIFTLKHGVYETQINLPGAVMKIFMLSFMAAWTSCWTKKWVV